MPGGRPAGAVVVIFFITETQLTTFVSKVFHLTNFWFDPVDTCGTLGFGGDPKVIFFISEAYAMTFISNIC